jgi:hypothetical protein
VEITDNNNKLSEADNLNLQKIEKLLSQSQQRVEAVKGKSDSLRLEDSNMGGEKAMFVLMAKLLSGSDIKKQTEELKLNQEQIDFLSKLQILSKENLEAAKELLGSDDGKKFFNEIFGANSNIATELATKQLNTGEAIKVEDILDASSTTKESIKETSKESAKEGAKETAKEAVKETAEESTKEVAKMVLRK